MPADRAFERLRHRFSYRCGYCGVREDDAGATLTVDHFQPVSRGGSDDEDNLVYACHACNEFKGHWWEAGSDNRLLHPLRDPVHEHVSERGDGQLDALTQRGASHIHRLRLNRSMLVAYRLQRRRVEQEQSTRRELLTRIAEVEERVQRLEADLEYHIRRLGGPYEDGLG